MQFLTSFYWEKGTRQQINQDSLCLQSVMTRKGPLLSACVCCGLDGLEQGETASGYAAECIGRWFYTELVRTISREADRRRILRAGRRLFYQIDRDLCEYGREKGIELATTASLLLIWQGRYYIFHVGDNRIYRMGRRMRQLTKDHLLGEQILTRCLGSPGMGRPECVCGSVRADSVFLLCSEGFRNYTSQQILKTMFSEKRMTQEETDRKLREVGRRNRERGEKASISAIYIQVRRKPIAAGGR